MTVEALLAPFTLSIFVKSDPETVMRLWSTSAGLKSFFLADAKFFEGDSEVPEASLGSTFEWTWVECSQETGRVLDMAPDRIAFTWYGDAGRVDVKVTPVGDETLVELTQKVALPSKEENLSAQYGCALGWTFWLANMKSILEGGIHLGEPDPNRRGVLNM